MSEPVKPPPNPHYRAEWSITANCGKVVFSTPNPDLMSVDDYDDALWVLEMAKRVMTRRKAEAERALHGEQPREGGGDHAG